MTSKWTRPEPGAWRAVAPRSVLDPEDPHGNPCRTPTDRRWLWHLETELPVNARHDSELGLWRALKQYLNETCDHHWISRPAGDDIPAHRQCLWCCDVIWADEEGLAADQPADRTDQETAA